MMEHYLGNWSFSGGSAARSEQSLAVRKFRGRVLVRWRGFGVSHHSIKTAQSDSSSGANERASSAQIETPRSGNVVIGEKNVDKIHISRSSRRAADSDPDRIAQNMELLQRLNDHKVANKNLEQMLNEKVHILKVLTCSVMYPEKRVASVEAENKLFNETAGKVATEYGERNAGIGNEVHSLVNSVRSSFVEAVTEANNSISKWCFREVSKPEHLTDHLRRSWNGRLELTTGNGLEGVSLRRVVPVDKFTIKSTGTYKRSFTTKQAVLVAHTEYYLNGAKSQGTYEYSRVALRESALSENRSYGVLKSRHIQCLSDTCTSRTLTARNTLFQRLGYHRLVSRFSACTNVDMS